MHQIIFNDQQYSQKNLFHLRRNYKKLETMGDAKVKAFDQLALQSLSYKTISEICAPEGKSKARNQRS